MAFGVPFFYASIAKFTSTAAAAWTPRRTVPILQVSVDCDLPKRALTRTPQETSEGYMLSSSRPHDDEFLSRALQKIAQRAGMSSGSIRIALHDGQVCLVVIQPRHQLSKNCGLDTWPEPNIETETINLDGLGAFVQSLVEEPIRTKIGPFAAVKARIESGSVSHWRISRLYRKRKCKRRRHGVENGSSSA